MAAEAKEEGEMEMDGKKLRRLARKVNEKHPGPWDHGDSLFTNGYHSVEDADCREVAEVGHCGTNAGSGYDERWVPDPRGALLAEYFAALSPDRVDAMLLALENVRALAARMRRKDPTNAAHLLRFCADAGVVGRVTRSATPAPAEGE